MRVAIARRPADDLPVILGRYGDVLAAVREARNKPTEIDTDVALTGTSLIVVDFPTAS